MKILVACEESQAVCIEFRKRGHEAYSCDILPCSGGHPEWHICDDVLFILSSVHFCTQDRKKHFINEWDMLIAFPPCTHLAVSGAAWFEAKRKDGRQQEGIDFFMKFTKTNIKKVSIENPVGIMSKIYREPDQIINPFYFGDPVPKKTCLWLKNLPKLVHCKSDNLFDCKTWVDPEFIIGKRDGKKYSIIHYQSVGKDPLERGKIRSKTFPGIAKAMADQWGNL
jgi:hypothetical protein